MSHLGSLSMECKSVNRKHDEMIIKLADDLCLFGELAQHLRAY